MDWHKPVKKLILRKIPDRQETDISPTFRSRSEMS